MISLALLTYGKWVLKEDRFTFFQVCLKNYTQMPERELSVAAIINLC